MFAFLACIASNVVFAGCLSVCVLALTRLWRNPHLAHALWLLVLVKLVTPPLVRIPMGSFGVVGDARSRVVAASEPVASGRSSAIREPRGATSPARVPTSELSGDARPKRVIHVMWSSLVAHWPLGVLTIWMIGTGSVMGIGLRRHLRLVRRIADGSPAEEAMVRVAEQVARRIGLATCPRLRVIAGHFGPFVTPGLRSPTVVLPSRFLEELNPLEVTTVLAHELAHVRRRDHWCRAFETPVLALYWWNPVAWLASRGLRHSEEECCDRLVVWALPDHRRVYGQTLLKAVEYLTRETAVPAVAATSFGGCALEKRIEGIMNRMLTHKMSGFAFALFAAIGATVLPVGLSQTMPDDDDAQVLQVAQQGWAECANQLESLQGTITMESQLTVNGKSTWERGTIRYLKNGKCESAELIAREVGPNAPFLPLQLHCINEDYGFRLSRDSNADAWKLTQVYDQASQPTNMPMWLFRGTLENVSPVTLQGRRSLLQLVRDKGFNAKQVTKLDDGRYRVEFVMQSDNAKRQPNATGELIETESTIKSGELTLNPRRHWALDSAKFIKMTHTQVHYTTEITFSYRSEEECVPSNVRFVVTSDNAQVTSGTWDYDIQLERSEDTPDVNRFRLPAYGFDEPDLAAPSDRTMQKAVVPDDPQERADHTAPGSRMDFFKSILSVERFYHVGWEGGVEKVVSAPDGQRIELHVRPSLVTLTGHPAFTPRTYRETWQLDDGGRLSLEKAEDGGGLGVIIVD
jgi:beta-lactamase regulating signal transducer with metallopeptidase domain